MATLSTANKDALQVVVDLMVKQSAVELPFDATLIERLARVAASTGFMGAGNFKEAARDKPISTLVSFVKFIGT